MKLGIETGSLINHIKGNTIDCQPEVGMGVTELCWSDRHPFTIIDISKTGKTITIQRDKAIRLDKNGIGENQDYKYERDPNGIVYKARKNKNGFWKIINGNRILIGQREEYYDYTF